MKDNDIPALKHTPSPWKWTYPEGPLDPPQLEGNIEYADQNPILAVHGCSPSCMHEYNKPCPLVPDKADMALISAAPDLLEACKGVLIGLEALETLGTKNIHLDRMRAAITKAGGPMQ